MCVCGVCSGSDCMMMSDEGVMISRGESRAERERERAGSSSI